MSTKKPGRPPVDTDLVRARLPRSDIEALDAFAASEADKPGRSEAVRRILRDWLIGHGFLKPE